MSGKTEILGFVLNILIFCQNWDVAKKFLSFDTKWNLKDKVEIPRKTRITAGSSWDLLVCVPTLMNKNLKHSETDQVKVVVKIASICINSDVQPVQGEPYVLVL